MRPSHRERSPAMAHQTARRTMSTNSSIRPGDMRFGFGYLVPRKELQVTETEARAGFDRLASIVRDAGLGWVVEQVVEYVSGGKLQEADVMLEYHLTMEGGVPVAKRGRR